MPTDNRVEDTRESFREWRHSVYNKGYGRAERIWIKIDDAGALYYDLKGLLSVAGCPLYALALDKEAFVLHEPRYGLVGGAPQVFGLLYELPTRAPLQVVYVVTRHLNWLLPGDLDQYVGPSLVNLLHDQVGSLAEESRPIAKLPDGIRALLREFREADHASHGGHFLENYAGTILTKVIQAGADTLAQHPAPAFNWSYFHVNEPISLGAGCAIIDYPGPTARVVSLSTLNASQAELMDLLDSVQPLSLANTALLELTEEGVNDAERRKYKQLARDFKES